MRNNNRGFTLVELMVALVIGLLISLAAVSSLIVTRRGFTTVDAASQLRDNARFASDLIQRVALQAGYKDPTYAIAPPSQKDLDDDANGFIAANITGFNKATFKSTSLTTANNRTTSDGSDILILRYQTAKLNGDPASSTSDGTMIDCAGNAISTVPQDRNDRMVSVFHIGVGTDGEPSLMCARSSTGLAPFTSQPIVRGVENFQVLYGVDGFTSVNQPFTNPTDSVPERYLRADQIVVGGVMASQATYNNWRRVRSIRIGMVIRGPANSQQEKVSQTFYPFGVAANSSTGTIGSALSSANDVGTVFTPPVDGRLRQVVTFTIHLRNDQGL
ncbi:PilW family protein [Rhodoferax sp.]|uniref:PilW family protein n=1 Tax=Rhodoferax sp. TaxID=50421 RepID=UPI00283BB664|nr:PilW family protein [Rhodoferax sp.]MDR3369601.1 PilW family protein [Rhodoferax sp.]